MLGGQQVSIDGLFADKELNYIKMDIEGYEKQKLTGAVSTLQKNGNLRLAVCTYHCKEDDQWVRSKLEEAGFDTDVSRGYICPDWCSAGYLDAEIRRGIVFGRKRQNALWEYHCIRPSRI